MLTAGSSFRNAPLAWRDRDLCQSAAAGMLHCEEAASVASSPLSLGAVRAGKGGTRVLHDGGVDGVVPDAALWSTDRVVGAAWCSRG